MAEKILIKNGTVVNADRQFKADVLCEDGRIVLVGNDLVDSTAVVIDASGLLVMPGGIDPHTHCQLPFMGTVAVDDFENGTKAAVCGGTTMIIDFVIPKPGESLLTAFDTWMEWSKTSVCDFSFHVAVTWFSDQVCEEMGVLARERGINSFKHFLAYKGALMLDDEALVQSFSRCKELGAISTVHAENGELVMLGAKRVKEQGIFGPEGHALSRPPAVEAEATNRAARIAQVINQPVYIVHVSCSDALDVVSRARREGQSIYGEVLSQHLVIDESVYRNTDWATAAAYIMSPPFRAKEHQEALWKGLISGDLATTASDHCVFNKEQRAMGKSDFAKIPNGVNGLEERLMLLWTNGVNTGRITPSQFVAISSTNTAKIFNIYPRKGCVSVGADADLVLWDPNLKRTLSVKTHTSKVDFSVYEGMEITGAPAFTISRGKVVYERGKFLGTKGAGKYVKRPAFGPVFDGVAKRDELSAPSAVARS